MIPVLVPQEHLSLKANSLASIHGDLSTLSHLRVRDRLFIYFMFNQEQEQFLI